MEWARCDGEPNKWFDRFQIYLLLGASRSVYAAYSTWREREGNARGTAHQRAGLRQSRGGLPKSWSEAAAVWQWQKRAESFDANERAQAMAEWETRRDALREQEWKLSQDLLDKARQMLVFPLAKTVRSQQGDGQTIVTEVYPAKWSIADAGRLLEIASRLGRLSLGEETDRVAHEFEVTSDDMAAARRAAQEWEQATYGMD